MYCRLISSYQKGWDSIIRLNPGTFLRLSHASQSLNFQRHMLLSHVSSHVALKKDTTSEPQQYIFKYLQIL
jgi:hypothetical protein